MAYPPPVPPATRTDATVMATNHPSDHNLISAALSEILNHIATLEQSVYPIGSTVLWGSDLPPGNHELCRGQEVSRASYPEVFSLIGVKFGSGNGSTTFNMPDMRGRYAIGYNAGGGYFSAGIGERYGSADAIVVSHNHNGADHAHPFATTNDGDHAHRTTSDPAVNALGAHAGGNDIAGGGGGPQIDYYSFTGNAGGHYHTGTTGAADRPLTTSTVGGVATNANLPPSTSWNYTMRMH